MITITIKTDNEAFSDGDRRSHRSAAAVEVGRILTRLAQEWYSVADGHKLRDINGNTVGSVKLTGKDRE